MPFGMPAVIVSGSSFLRFIGEIRSGRQDLDKGRRGRKHILRCIRPGA